MCAPISGIMLVFFLFTGTYNNTQWNLSNQDTNWAEGSVLLVRWPLSGIYLGQERVHVIKVFHCIYTAVENVLYHFQLFFILLLKSPAIPNVMLSAHKLPPIQHKQAVLKKKGGNFFGSLEYGSWLLDSE